MDVDNLYILSRSFYSYALVTDIFYVSDPVSRSNFAYGLYVINSLISRSELGIILKDGKYFHIREHVFLDLWNLTFQDLAISPTVTLFMEC